MAGVGVEPGCVPPPGFATMQIPAATYAVFRITLNGSALHPQVKQAMAAIWGELIPASGLKVVGGPDFELYDGRFDPQKAGLGDRLPRPRGSLIAAAQLLGLGGSVAGPAAVGGIVSDGSRRGARRARHDGDGLLDVAAAGHAARHGGVHARGALEAVGLVAARQRLAALALVGGDLRGRRALQVVLARGLQRGTGFLQAGLLALGRLAGQAVRAILLVARLGGRGRPGRAALAEMAPTENVENTTATVMAMPSSSGVLSNFMSGLLLLDTPVLGIRRARTTKQSLPPESSGVTVSAHRAFGDDLPLGRVAFPVLPQHGLAVRARAALVEGDDHRLLLVGPGHHAQVVERDRIAWAATAGGGMTWRLPWIITTVGCGGGTGGAAGVGGRGAGLVERVQRGEVVAGAHALPVVDGVEDLGAVHLRRVVADPVDLAS